MSMTNAVDTSIQALSPRTLASLADVLAASAVSWAITTGVFGSSAFFSSCWARAGTAGASQTVPARHTRDNIHFLKAGPPKNACRHPTSNLGEEGIGGTWFG